MYFRKKTVTKFSCTFNIVPSLPSIWSPSVFLQNVRQQAHKSSTEKSSAGGLPGERAQQKNSDGQVGKPGSIAGVSSQKLLHCENIALRTPGFVFFQVSCVWYVHIWPKQTTPDEPVGFIRDRTSVLSPASKVHGYRFCLIFHVRQSTCCQIDASCFWLLQGTVILSFLLPSS